MSDESKLFIRFTFAFFLLCVQILLGKKFFSLFLAVKKNEEKESKSMSSDQSQLLKTISSSGESQSNHDDKTTLFDSTNTVRSRSILIGALLPSKEDDSDRLCAYENKFRGKFFMLKKTKDYLKKTRMTSVGYEDSQWNQLCWWYQRRLFQIKRLVAWKTIPFLRTYSIPERVQILIFQITRFVNNVRNGRASKIILALAVIAGLHWKEDILELFHSYTSTTSSSNSTVIDLFSLDMLGDKIQAGDLIEVISVSDSPKYLNKLFPKIGVMKKTLNVVQVRILRDQSL